MFRALLVLGVWLTMEAISWFALWWLYGGWTRAQRIQTAASQGDPLGAGVVAPLDVIHPYLGYVRRRTTAADATRRPPDKPLAPVTD